MRVFIAVELPEHVRARIFHSFEVLFKKGYFRGRFVEKDNLHLTLKFIDEATEEDIENIKKKLNEIKFNKFNCEIGETGFFDSEEYIKVIWIELISEMLEPLHLEISKKFPEIKKNFKKFSPHITTARVRSVKDKKRLVEEAKSINLKKLDFEVNEFVLMKSELTREGVKYKVIERFKLN